MRAARHPALAVVLAAVLGLAVLSGCASRGSTSGLASADRTAEDAEGTDDDGPDGPADDAGEDADGGAADGGDAADGGGDGDGEDGDDQRGDDGDDGDDGGGADGGDVSGGTSPQFDPDPDSALCQYLRQVDIDGLELDMAADPATVEDTMRQLIEAMTGARDVAPDELAADLTILTDGLVELDAVLASADYDVETLSERGEAQAVIDVVSDPAFVDANERVTAYHDDACGL